MIIHYILFLLTALFAKAAEKKNSTALKSPEQEKEETRASFIAGILAYTPTIILYGLRENMGDTLSYIESFNLISPQGVFDNLEERNPGYCILRNFIRLYITDNANVFILILTFISVALMVKTHSRYSPMFGLSAFIFFGSTEVSYVFNGARQFLAISIMFYTLKFVEEKKLIKYIIFSIIAFSIHQTAIVVIPAYFIARGKFFNMRIVVMGLATIAATAFSSFFIDYVNDMFISESVYAHYYTQIVETEGINIFRVLVAAIPFAICMVYKKRIDELDDKVLNYCANMSTLALAVSVFSAASGGQILGRLAEYYLIYNTLTYPMVFKRVVKKDISRILTICLLIGYFVFFFYQFTVIWEIGYDSTTLGISLGMENI